MLAEKFEESYLLQDVFESCAGCALCGRRRLPLTNDATSARTRPGPTDSGAGFNTPLITHKVKLQHFLFRKLNRIK